MEANTPDTQEEEEAAAAAAGVAADTHPRRNR